MAGLPGFFNRALKKGCQQSAFSLEPKGSAVRRTERSIGLQFIIPSIPAPRRASCNCWWSLLSGRAKAVLEKAGLASSPFNNPQVEGLCKQRGTEALTIYARYGIFEEHSKPE